MQDIDQVMNSQRTLHVALLVSYGVSFVSTFVAVGLANSSEEITTSDIIWIYDINVLAIMYLSYTSMIYIDNVHIYW